MKKDLNNQVYEFYLVKKKKNFMNSRTILSTNEIPLNIIVRMLDRRTIDCLNL